MLGFRKKGSLPRSTPMTQASKLAALVTMASLIIGLTTFPAKAALTISTVSPNIGSSIGGTLVTITGSDFSTVSSLSLGANQYATSCSGITNGIKNTSGGLRSLGRNFRFVMTGTGGRGNTPLGNRLCKPRRGEIIIAPTIKKSTDKTPKG